MLIVMDRGATADDVRRVVDAVEGLGLKAHPIPGAQRTAIGITGNRGSVEPAAFENLPGVVEVIPVSHPTSSSPASPSARTPSSRSAASRWGDRGRGRRGAVRRRVARADGRRSRGAVRHAGRTLYRGGAFKPRTSPYSFQGLGEEGLKILARGREETGLPIVTEVARHRDVELVAEYADCLQIGARNMQNFALLKAAGRIGKPVLLKRGMSATIEEFLLSAEYILAEGNYDVMLCERGVRTFATTRATRSTSRSSRTSSGSRTCRSSSIPRTARASGTRCCRCRAPRSPSAPTGR